MNALTVIALVLMAAVALSAVGVVYSTHANRQLFSQLEESNRERDRLDAEWGMLQLEQGAWATHGRVESIARERLNMTTPGSADVIILRR